MSTIPTLDLSFAKHAVKVAIPAPDGETPDLCCCLQSPSRFWRVTTRDGELVGYLGLYDFGTGKKLLLTVYGRNAGLIANWLTLSVPGLDSVIHIAQLEAQSVATIVILSRDDPEPPEMMDTILVRAAISLDGAVPDRLSLSSNEPGRFYETHQGALLASDEITNSTPANSPQVPPPGGSIASAARPSPSANQAMNNGRRTEAARPANDILIPLAKIEARPTSWLIPGCIAAGKVTLIAGEPGLGKSMLTADLAAAVSSGRPWGARREPSLIGDVVIVSPEDDAQETLKPRLLSAGAREDRIHVWSGSHSFIGLDAILEQAEALADIRLLIIDPISACLGGKNLNRASDVREILMGLAAWAEERGAAVVVVTHLNKIGRGRSPLSRILGSQVFGAVARSAYLVSSDPADEAQRLFLPLKDSIGSIPQGLVFRIEEVILPDGIRSARVVFCDGPTNLTAAEALTALQAAPAKTSVLTETKAFLRDFLEAGAQSVGAVTEAEEAHGITMASLRRACRALGIKPRKTGMSEGWVWALPALK